METFKTQLKTYLPILLGLSSIMSLIAISDLPYGYYNFLRLVIFSTGTLYLIFFRNQLFPIVDITVFIVVLMWNPIFPVYLTKEIWTVLNVMVSIGGIILILLMRKQKISWVDFKQNISCRIFVLPFVLTLNNVKSVIHILTIIICTLAKK